MTQARRAQRRIFAREIVLPSDAAGCVGWEIYGLDGSRRYYFADKSMIIYFRGLSWPDVWTVSEQMKNLNRLFGKAKSRRKQ